MLKLERGSDCVHLYILRVQRSKQALDLPLPIVDRSSAEIEQRIRRKVEGIKDVKGIRHVTVRLSAKRLDVDVHVYLDSDLTTENTHRVASNIEKKVRVQYPNARVFVDTEPFKSKGESIWNSVKDAAEGTPGSRGAHNIHVQTVDGKLYVDMHLEVSANMTVKQAHDVADVVQEKIKALNPGISGVTVHIESASERISKELTGAETELESFIEDAARKFPEIRSVKEVRIRRFDDTIHVVISCKFNPNLTIKKAHEVSSELERNIKKAYPNIERIDVHEEPG
jgi:divalent metal cation (Fe/Co/Zn/Cd) transporter